MKSKANIDDENTSRHEYGRKTVGNSNRSFFAGVLIYLYVRNGRMLLDEAAMEEKHNDQPPIGEGLPRELEDALTSALYLAGDALIPDRTAEEVTLAAQNEGLPLLSDFAWLSHVIAAFREAIQEDAGRIELLRLLPQAMANGENLRVLYSQLFPEQRTPRPVFRAADGRRKLTEAQVEILRETARGQSPAQIASARGCTETNITTMLTRARRNLNARTTQEAIAVAISMNYLPLDVLDWTLAAANCSVKNYSQFDTLISGARGIEKTAESAYWRDMASMGLLLLLASAAGVHRQLSTALAYPQNGVLFRLESEPNGTYKAHRIVGPGLLRNPRGLVIAPPCAQRAGFTPGNLFVSHSRAAYAAGNTQEILEMTPEGGQVRAFCGGRTLDTRLDNTQGLAFAPTGELLATSSGALLEFSEGGGHVLPKVKWCCPDVSVDKQGRVYLSRYSSRGSSIGIYSALGQLLREWEPVTPPSAFICLRPLQHGREIHLLALRDTGEKILLHFNAQGEIVRHWPVPGAAEGAFTLDSQTGLLYIPCVHPPSIAVYGLEGTLKTRILLDKSLIPAAVTINRNGSLWLIGNQH